MQKCVMCVMCVTGRDDHAKVRKSASCASSHHVRRGRNVAAAKVVFDRYPHELMQHRADAPLIGRPDPCDLIEAKRTSRDLADRHTTLARQIPLISSSHASDSNRESCCGFMCLDSKSPSGHHLAPA